MKFLPALIAATLVLSACQTSGQSAPPPAGSPEAIALDAVADVSGRPTDGMDIVSSEEVQFRDSSLGCPQPGMAYAQVISDGHRVIVNTGGQRYDVRVAGGRGKVCVGSKSQQDGFLPPADAEAADEAAEKSAES